MPTTITKTIGVGKDYASIDAWVAGAASTYPSGLVAADVIWRGVLYKEGSGTNNEWVISTTTTTLCCSPQIQAFKRHSAMDKNGEN